MRRNVSGNGAVDEWVPFRARPYVDVDDGTPHSVSKATENLFELCL